MLDIPKTAQHWTWQLALKTTVSAPGREDQSDKMKIVKGGTWAVIVFPEDGYFATQIY